MAALLRAGTLGQSATLFVFLGELFGNWAPKAKAIPVDLDPGPAGAAEEHHQHGGHLRRALGRDELLALAIHPVVRVLQAAAHRLPVLEAQSAVLDLVGGYGPRHWARIRVALRDNEDIRRLAPFLDSLHQCGPAAAPASLTSCWRSRRSRAITPGSSPRLPRPARPRLPLWPGDHAAGAGEPAGCGHGLAVRGQAGGADELVVLTMCTDARSNVESDIMQALARARPRLELTGLEYAPSGHGHRRGLHARARAPRGRSARRSRNRAGRDPALAEAARAGGRVADRNELGHAVDDPCCGFISARFPRRLRR